MIKLTNALKEHDGNALLINPKHILTIHETTKEIPGKPGKVETVTNIYTIIQQAWTVKESLDDIYAMIQKFNDKK